MNEEPERFRQVDHTGANQAAELEEEPGAEELARLIAEDPELAALAGPLVESGAEATTDTGQSSAQLEETIAAELQELTSQAHAQHAHLLEELRAILALADPAGGNRAKLAARLAGVRERAQKLIAWAEGGSDVSD